MSQQYRQPPSSTSRIGPLVLVTWAALSVAAFCYVLMLGANVPSADEWDFVSALTGHEDALPWLWAQHNEHRLPLPRAVYLALFWTTHDFRAGMVLQVAMLSALSLWLTRLAARFRGRPHWADVFFPVSLLHVGHWENFLMGYQICFVLFTVLATAIGVIALRTTSENAFRSGILTGLLSFLLALCGSSGLVAVLPVMGWLGYLTLLLRRQGAPRQAAALGSLVALLAAYFALYFVGYEHPPKHPPATASAHPALAVAMVTGETLAMALGIGIADIWWAVAAGTVVLGGATLGAIGRDAKVPAKRPALAGLVAVAMGVAGVALAIGVGRAGLDENRGLWSRYSLLMWPLLGLAYLFWVQRGGPGGRTVSLVLCVASALAFPTNTGTGIQIGAHLHSVMSAVESDIQNGVPPETIVLRFKDTYQEGQEEAAVQAIPMLREAGSGVPSRRK